MNHRELELAKIILDFFELNLEDVVDDSLSVSTLTKDIVHSPFIKTLKIELDIINRQEFEEFKEIKYGKDKDRFVAI